MADALPKHSATRLVAQPRCYNLGNKLPRFVIRPRGGSLKVKAPVGAGAFWESVLGWTWRGLPDQNNPPRRKAFQNNAKKRSPALGSTGAYGGSGKTANSVGASITSLAAGPRWFCDKSHNEGKGAPAEADAPAQRHLSFSTTERKHLHSIAHICGPLADGGSGHADAINSRPKGPHQKATCVIMPSG